MQSAGADVTRRKESDAAGIQAAAVTAGKLNDRPHDGGHERGGTEVH